MHIHATPYEQTKAMNAAATDVLDLLRDEGWTPQEIEQGAAALGIGISDIATWRGLADEGKIDRAEQEFRTRWTAYQMEQVLENRATLDNVAVMNIPTDELEDALNYSEDMTRELFAQIPELDKTVQRHSESPRLCQLKEKVREWAWYRWQVARRMGLY